MNCEPERVACQLSRIIESSSGWDWNAFFETLSATLVGALLGFVSVYFAFRLQRQQRYAEVLDECLVKVLDAMAERAETLNAYVEQKKKVTLSNLVLAGSNAEKISMPKPPFNFTVPIALEVARMRARGEDQEIIADIATTYKKIPKSLLPDKQVQYLGFLAGTISRWRSEKWDRQRVQKQLAPIDTAAESNKDVVYEDDVLGSN